MDNDNFSRRLKHGISADVSEENIILGKWQRQARQYYGVWLLTGWMDGNDSSQQLPAFSLGMDCGAHLQANEANKQLQRSEILPRPALGCE
jgi:hypothetical protein